MDIFLYDWVSFFIVGIATMLLLGELLVNARGLFAIFGMSFITLYFLAYLDPSMFFIMAIIYFVGIILIFIDGQFVNDGALAAIGGFLMIISVGFSSPNWVVGLYAIIGVVIGAVTSVIWLKILPKRRMWSEIALLDQLTDEEGYSSLNNSYKELVGKKGMALTDMRPVGTIKINDSHYSAISDGQWISNGKPVIVQQVDGTKILVKEVVQQITK